MIAEIREKEKQRKRRTHEFSCSFLLENSSHRKLGWEYFELEGKENQKRETRIEWVLGCRDGGARGKQCRDLLPE